MPATRYLNTPTVHETKHKHRECQYKTTIAPKRKAPCYKCPNLDDCPGNCPKYENWMQKQNKMNNKEFKEFMRTGDIK